MGDCGEGEACHAGAGRGIAIGLGVVAVLAALLGIVFAGWARQMPERGAKRLFWAGVAVTGLAALRIAWVWVW